MSNERLSIKEINKYINSQLKSKYKTNENIHNVVCIENIIFNEKCHLVALFKDFLIYDDDYEFLKRFYNLKESNKKLNLYFSYYEQYSISYPNYTILPESKYIYKNIHKKQRMLEKQQSIEKDEIDAAYKKFHSVRKAADYLGMSMTTYVRKRQEYSQKKSRQ